MCLVFPLFFQIRLGWTSSKVVNGRHRQDNVASFLQKIGLKLLFSDKGPDSLLNPKIP